MEEVGNYGKVGRIKYGASVYGDNKDTCGGKWKIKDLLDKRENRIKYKGVEE